MADMTNGSSKSAEYNDDSITSLEGATRIRTRPASMLGSNGIAGARHCFTEIVGNALDEVSAGYGDRLEVTYYADDAISVRDYGRGVPIGWNEKRAHWNWHIVFNELYGGSKYDSGQDYLSSIKDWTSFDEKRVNYLYSVGLNGLGAASTQYTSEYFEVRSYRDGKCSSMNFRGGKPIFDGKPLDFFEDKVFLHKDIVKYAPHIEDSDEPTGTFIKWKPDPTVFDDIEDGIGADWVYNMCRDIAYVAGIDFVFHDEKSGRTEEIKRGNLTDLLISHYGNKLYRNENDERVFFANHGFSHGVKDSTNWVCKADVMIALATSKLGHLCYHNSVKMGGGVQYYGVASAIDTFFTEVSRERGIRLENSDYDGSFVVAVSTYSNTASFRGQTKDEVDDSFIREIVYNAVYDKLVFEYRKGNADIKDIIDTAVERAEERIAAREALKLAKEARKVTRSNKTPEKFKTCKAFMKKDYASAELWIAEGDSAAGAINMARNSDFQAVIPMTGKFLNVLKCSLEKIVKSEVIQNIFTLLGTGMDIGIDDSFNIDNLRFNKIIFATDADEDGFQIRVLLFLLFYRLAPEIIKQGHVFIAETPRFAIHLVNGKNLYARDDAERDAIKKQYEGSIKSISRFKGLGEVDSPVLRETTVHPDTRNLIPVTVDFDDTTSRDIIDALFGADKYGLRKPILANLLGQDVADMLEENALNLKLLDDENIDDGIEYTEVEVS